MLKKHDASKAVGEQQVHTEKLVQQDSVEAAIIRIYLLSGNSHICVILVNVRQWLPFSIDSLSALSYSEAVIRVK